jgi:hypothetical protein
VKTVQLEHDTVLAGDDGSPWRGSFFDASHAGLVVITAGKAPYTIRCDGGEWMVGVAADKPEAARLRERAELRRAKAKKVG